jgi:hypothetical protein
MEDARAEHEAKLASHRSRVSELKKSGEDPFLLATEEFGVAYERAFLRWLDSVPGA